jgi:hypothetical protein
MFGDDSPKSKLLMVVLVVVITGGGLSIYRSLRGRHGATGEIATPDRVTVVAEETGRVLRHKGQVVLLTRDPKDAPIAQEEQDKFKNALAAAGAIGLAGVETIALAEAETVCGIPARFYGQLLQEYPEVDAVVSFVGAPELTATDIDRLPRRLPRMIVLSPCGIDPAELLKSGVLDVIILPRAVGPPPEGRKFETPREKFEYYYQVIRAETVGSSPPANQ